MYGQYVEIAGIEIFVFGVPSMTEKEWKMEARKEILRRLSGEEKG